jgi:hypothetical protein
MIALRLPRRLGPNTVQQVRVLRAGASFSWSGIAPGVYYLFIGVCVFVSAFLHAGLALVRVAHIDELFALPRVQQSTLAKRFISTHSLERLQNSNLGFAR